MMVARLIEQIRKIERRGVCVEISRTSFEPDVEDRAPWSTERDDETR
jgi:hypothetical protein